MINYYRNLEILNTKDKKKFFMIIFLGLIGSIFEVMGIGIIVPFVLVITDENVLNNNVYISQFANFFSIEDRDKIIILFICIILFIYSFKTIYLTYVSWIKNSYSYKLQAKLSTKVFNIFLKQPYIFYSSLNSSKLLQETKDEPSTYISSIIIGTLDMLSEVLIITGILALLLYYNFLPSLIIFITIILILVLYKMYFRKRTVVWSKQNKHFNRLGYNILKYVYGSIIEVKISNKEEIVKNKFSKFVNTSNENLTKQMFMTDVPRLYLEFIAVFFFMFFVLFAYNYFSDFNKFIPSVALYAVSAFKILPSMNRIVVGIQKVNFGTNSLYVLQRIFKLDYIDTEVKTKKKFEFNKKIELKDISFSYNNKKNILNKVNLTFNFGDIVGIKGGSGVGKTTLMNLILGLLKPDEGEILIDGKTIDKKEKSWQSIISYAPQNAYIIDDSIKKNICFEEDEDKIDIEHLKSVIQLSSLNNLVSSLDEELDTVIGENGSQLSGGQIQRISFARAIYKKPKFIVFDEITSSLDKVNEKIILESIKKLSSKMTVILISHREEPLSICDKIYEMQDGQII
jgi:ATP-binding cassette, subfamily B, bacterial PglK